VGRRRGAARCGCQGPPVASTRTQRARCAGADQRRQALTYRFVRGVLEAVFGERTLSDMRRLRAEGPGAWTGPSHEAHVWL
jgi:hypothetical protein